LSVRLGRKVLTPGLISCLDSPRPVLATWAPFMACDLQEASSPLISFLLCSSYKSRQRIRSTQRAGLRSITHRGYLFAPPVLAELLSEAPRFLSGISSHVTYCSATFLLVPLFPLLPSGVILHLCGFIMNWIRDPAGEVDLRILIVCNISFSHYWRVCSSVSKRG